MTILEVSRDIVEVLKRGYSKERAIQTWGEFRVGNRDLADEFLVRLDKYEPETIRAIIQEVEFLLTAVYTQAEVNDMEDADSDLWLLTGD